MHSLNIPGPSSWSLGNCLIRHVPSALKVQVASSSSGISRTQISAPPCVSVLSLIYIYICMYVYIYIYIVKNTLTSQNIRSRPAHPDIHVSLELIALSVSEHVLSVALCVSNELSKEKCKIFSASPL